MVDQQLPPNAMMRDQNGVIVRGPQQGNGYQQAPKMEAQSQPGLMVVPLQQLGRLPAPIDCPRCHSSSVTTIEHISGHATQCVTPFLSSFIPEMLMLRS